MGILPKLDKFPGPARMQRLGVFTLLTILIVLFLENAFPGGTITNLHRRVRWPSTSPRLFRN
jgi:hypothetical protein